MAETELVHLRQEILLLGELHLKYRDRLERTPQTMAQNQAFLFQQAFEKELEGKHGFKLILYKTKACFLAMRNDILEKTQELEATKAKVFDLEQTISKKDQILSEQKKLIERIKVNYFYLSSYLLHCISHFYLVIFYFAFLF